MKKDRIDVLRYENGYTYCNVRTKQHNSTQKYTHRSKKNYKLKTQIKNRQPTVQVQTKCNA